MNTPQNQLDRLLDEFQEWTAIYGNPSPGYCEPHDRKRERESFEKEITSLRTAIAKAEGLGQALTHTVSARTV